MLPVMQEGEVIHFAEQDGISLIMYHVRKSNVFS